MLLYEVYRDIVNDIYIFYKVSEKRERREEAIRSTHDEMALETCTRNSEHVENVQFGHVVIPAIKTHLSNSRADNDFEPRQTRESHVVKRKTKVRSETPLKCML